MKEKNMYICIMLIILLLAGCTENNALVSVNNGDENNENFKES